MEWIKPDAGVVTEHNSSGLFMTELARFATVGEYRTFVCEVEPGGLLGRHVGARRVLWQLFYVLAGSGWVSGEDGKKQEIQSGQAVMWSPDESHESGSENGMTVIMVMSDHRLPSGE